MVSITFSFLANLAPKQKLHDSSGQRRIAKGLLTFCCCCKRESQFSTKDDTLCINHTQEVAHSVLGFVHLDSWVVLHVGVFFKGEG